MYLHLVSSFSLVIYVCFVFHFPVKGLYSRGKSHVLRLAIPIQQLLNFWNTLQVQDDEQGSQQTPKRDATPGDNQSEETDDSDNDTLDDVNNDASMSGEAINIAASIVGTCLAQLCKYQHNYT